MPRRPRTLPPALTGRAFTTQRAIALGVDPKRLRGSDLRRPFHGIQVDARSADGVIDRCRAYLVRMPPDGSFCGPTAALIQGVPLPRHLERATVLHVAVPWPRRAVRREGIVGHRLQVLAPSIRTWNGLPVTEPARTWRDLATVLSLDDLIAAGDFIVGGDLPLASVEELGRAARAASGGRGAVRLAGALPLIDGRSASRRETRLRLILLRAGIGGFEPNLWVTVTAPAARYRIDIAFPTLMIGFEYQGEYHHDIDQWRADLTRQSRLRAAGWTMIEFSAPDLDDPRELVHRIRALLARQGTVPTRKPRVTG